LTLHSPCHFISRALIPYTAQMKQSCVKGVGGGPRSLACRRLIRPDVLRGQGAPLSAYVHAAAELSRLVTYNNATIGAAAVCQLHKRARRGRPPARRGLSRYPPHDPPFCALSLLSLAAPVAAVSRHQFCSAVAAVVVVTSNKVSN